MKYKIFSFGYLKSRPIKLMIFGIALVFGCIAPLYYLWYWENVKYKVEIKYTQKVYLYDINSKGDTLNDVLAIKEIKYKDSLIKFYERRFNGEADLINIPFAYLRGGPFPIMEYTKDSLLGKIIFANYTSPKYYKEYFVFIKSIH
ncbi:MAG: hypothetical protein ABI554_15040, partial [Flavobacterium sp.]